MTFISLGEFRRSDGSMQRLASSPGRLRSWRFPPVNVSPACMYAASTSSQQYIFVVSVSSYLWSNRVPRLYTCVA